jgi:HTH-type transcriptional regulator/antitoxin MqsA
MNCMRCSGEYEEVTEPVTLRVQGRTVTADRTALRCPACGDTVASLQHAAELQRRVGAAIREKEGLLQPGEIEALRTALGLNKAHFERLLGTGPKTVVRWEGGTVFQSKTADRLMRAVRDVPGVAEYLAALHGVTLKRQGSVIGHQADAAGAGPRGTPPGRATRRPGAAPPTRSRRGRSDVARRRK